MLLNKLDKQTLMKPYFDTDPVFDKKFKDGFPIDREGRNPYDKLIREFREGKTQWYCVIEVEQAGHWFLKKVVSDNKGRIYKHLENYDDYNIVILAPMDDDFIKV